MQAFELIDDEATINREWMMRAISLALRGEGFVEPNPMVGCVLIRDGQWIGEGYHHRFGDDHAEVDALKSLPDPSLARGATAYVTLEPCCHTGKTPPCTQALIAAGIAKVFVAMRDPFPRVDGGGIRQLRDVGIDVEVGVAEVEARDLNSPYLKRLHHKRPWVIGKWAMTLDGRIATASGDSQWISGELSRGEVHRLRGRVDAVIVGAGTMLADNPTLTARPSGPRIATRIVVAGSRLPSIDSKLVQAIPQAPLIILTKQAESPDSEILRRLGAEIIVDEGESKVESVMRLLDELGRREMTNVLVEGGGELLASFAEADELDEIHTYIAPKLIGGRRAPGPIGGEGVAKMGDAALYETLEISRFDCDLRIITRRIRG